MQKYLIISDIHDNLANLAVLAQKEPPENLSGLIVAGDVCAWDTVLEMQRLFPVSTWLVAGNGDYDWPQASPSAGFVIASEGTAQRPGAKQSLLNNFHNPNLKLKTLNLKLTYFKHPYIFQINNFTIGLAHEPAQAKDLTDKNPNLDYVIFGHTHWPTTETWGATIALNSGNLAGVRAPATYATLDFVSPKNNPPSPSSPPFFQLHRLYRNSENPDGHSPRGIAESGILSAEPTLLGSPLAPIPRGSATGSSSFSTTQDYPMG